MWPESGEPNREQQDQQGKQTLRSGLTTGTCATACCVAAAQSLLAHKQPTSVDVLLPKGKQVSLLIEGYQRLEATDALSPLSGIRTSTIKDAGDDPDVTHGALVFVELRLTDEPSVTFKSALGVGTVTREGLVLAVGDAAINPVPRKMMTEHLQKAALVYGYDGGFEVSVGVEKGEQIALKTMNSRLGILGGLSILGTTGIVRPYSCAAYIASIHQGIDVASSNGVQHIAATTGSTSETAIQMNYGLEEMALIEMGDFVGAVLKHLRKVPIARVSICGGFGKISKLANGHMDLNSRASNIDFDKLASWAQECSEGNSAEDSLLDAIRGANTSMQALKLCQDKGLALGDLVCQHALARARKVLAKVPLQKLSLEVFAVDRQGSFVGSASEIKT